MTKALAVFLLALSSRAFTQTNATFDVASVKPAAPGDHDGLLIQPGGRLVVTNFTLKTLIAIAYHLAPFQLSGAEGWMANDRWSIVAKADSVSDVPAWTPPYIPEVMASRLRALLEDRFALKTHREPRDLKAYLLIVSKSGSRLTAADAAQPALLGKMKAGPGIIVSDGATIDQLVLYLNRLMDMPVVDKTGITGFYKLDLHFAPESTHPLDSTPSTDPTIFDALVEQLGLNLRTAKEPIDVLVVDSASKPTGN